MMYVINYKGDFNSGYTRLFVCSSRNKSWNKTGVPSQSDMALSLQDFKEAMQLGSCIIISPKVG